MTDQNGQQPTKASNASNVRGDTSKVLEELSKSNSAKVNPKRSGWRRFFLIVFLLSPALGITLFLIFEQSRTDAILTELQRKDALLEEALAKTSTSQLASVAPPAELRLPDNLADTMMLDELSTSLDMRINALARNAANIEERIGALPQANETPDWMWTEAEYLLRLANQKLQLEGDADSALLILTSVDQMLEESGEISVLGVRELLGNEMLALRNMEFVDVSGLYLRINNLMPMIEELSLREARVENYKSQLARTRNEVAESDAGIMDRGLAVLESIFVWQDWDVEPEALLPPAQEATLKQNLRLMLEQAQLSLLMAEQQIYDSSIEKSAQWADRYFAVDVGAGRTLKEELGELLTKKVVAERPSISGSLELLRLVNAGRKQSLTPDGP